MTISRTSVEFLSLIFNDDGEPLSIQLGVSMDNYWPWPRRQAGSSSTWPNCPCWPVSGSRRSPSWLPCAKCRSTIIKRKRRSASRDRHSSDAHSFIPPQIDNVHLTTEIEPSVLAMSDVYIAVGFNNRALYYRIQSIEGNGREELERSLQSIVSSRSDQSLGTWLSQFDQRVTDQLAIRCGLSQWSPSIAHGQRSSSVAQFLWALRLQIEESDQRSEERQSILFPLPDSNDGRIICFSLTKEFLIFATDVRDASSWSEWARSSAAFQKGVLNFFYIEDWKLVNKFDKHKVSIQKLFPENFGTSVAFIDQKGDGYLYNVVSPPTRPLPPSLTLAFSSSRIRVSLKFLIFPLARSRFSGKRIWRTRYDEGEMSLSSIVGF